jgi:hypothetical protein
MSKSNPPKDDNEVESHVLEKYEVLSKLGKVREFALISSLFERLQVVDWMLQNREHMEWCTKQLTKIRIQLR